MKTGTARPLPARGPSSVPLDLLEALREATIDQDAERLFELVDGVADHDGEVADYLRGLIEAVAYEALEEFFDAQGG